MSFRTFSVFALAFAGSLIWIAGAASPAAAQEVATAVAPPAARFSAISECRIVSPTFEPDARREGVIEARYPGGGRLSLPVAAPCPSRVVAFDV